jgi:hypothetical protein
MSDTEFSGRRKSIILGGETATTDVVETSGGSGLSRADIAAAGQRPAPEPGRAEQASPGNNPHAPFAGTAPTDDHSGPLFSPDEAKDLRTRWDAIQVEFVDEPRQSVEQADSLVASTIKRLAEVFADERQKLESQWGRGENVSTEDLRLALRRYRSFFGRLLSV